MMCFFIHKLLHHFAERGTRKKRKTGWTQQTLHVAASLLSHSFYFQNRILQNKSEDWLLDASPWNEGGKKNTGNTITKRDTKRSKEFSKSSNQRRLFLCLSVGLWFLGYFFMKVLADSRSVDLHHWFQDLTGNALLKKWWLWKMMFWSHSGEKWVGLSLVGKSQS